MRIRARDAALAMADNQGGILRRRLSDEHILDMYLVNDQFKKSISLEIGKLSEDVKLPEVELGDVLDVQLLDGRGILSIELLAMHYADVFYVLIDDLIESVVSTEGAEAGGIELVRRLNSWERLLEASVNGLSKNSQKGLFGELTVLKSISEVLGVAQALASWFGPESGIRDYEIGGTGIEVKTTSLSGALNVKISSERQLELVAVQQLFIWCVSIEKVAKGLDLNTAVNEIKGLIGAEKHLTDVFEKKLAQAGYFEHDKNRYKSEYALRDEIIFRIEDDFPSIVSEDLDDCIYDVSYRIMLEGCSKWSMSREQFLEELSNE